MRRCSIRYYVFRCKDGALRYCEQSLSLGAGEREIRYIIQCHDLRPGDVLVLNNEHYEITEGGYVWLDPAEYADKLNPVQKALCAA